MDVFVEHLKMVLPLVGFDLFRRLRPAARPSGNGGSSDDATFSFSTSGAEASARETEDGFVVLAGSTARKGQSGTFPAGYLALREKLIAGQQLVDDPSASIYRFMVDVAFSSPSAAASIIAARSASGPLEWKLAGSGQSYRDWRGASLG